MLEALLEADVDVTDVENEDGKLTVFAPNTEYFMAKTALTEMGIEEFEADEIQFIPQSFTQISDEDTPMFEKVLAILDDNDDVQQDYHNIEL